MEMNPGQPDPPFEEGLYKLLQVVPGIGPYQTIQEAINAASPGTKIVVSSTLYTQPVFINKPGLVLESQEASSEVQITCSAGPIIYVSLNPGETCRIKGFKLIHTAVSRKRLEALGNLGGETYLDMCESSRTSEHWVRNLKLSRSTNCALWVDGGNVSIEDCQVTLSSAKSPLPAIVINKGHLKIENCEIKGQGEVPTVGIYTIESDITVLKSKIYKHRSGGIIVYSKPTNKILISECQIIGNVNCGVYFLGEDSRPVIQRSKIAHNEDGIKIAQYNCAQIKGCEIKQNEKGVNVENADPFIFLNLIRGNREEGVYFHSEGDGRCDGKMMSNDLYENENAVVCCGPACFPIIEGNGKVAKNKKAGIKVMDGAHAVILRNEIYENKTQGILLVKGSSAHIEKNNIYSNKKANVAFGGSENSDTTIVENSIFRGQAEGIFNLEGGTSWIKRNQIYENSDGIVLIDSYPVITMNSIYDNRRSGITVAGRSQPNIVDNEVLRNTAVGINIRDMATGLLLRNYAFGNLVQMAIITKSRMNIKQIKKENYIKGEVQLPLPAICSIM
ncbi:hypothetical protein SteCoe_6246 [Stentor coeruleus]|uniref:Uncharacterized protein n=1 Tax=Stentor coeruleus TaxID=5963 RepID=A0A1R2CQI5_9CILI|nr:hypothetical protein SteCoe_6246 [Stentor coeruleus]